jgi:hypothetical protein
MLEHENRRFSEVNEVVKRDIGEVSGPKGLLENLEAKHEQLLATVARHGDELEETRRRNSELRVRVEQLEGENCRFCDSSEGLKSQLKVPHEAGQQNAVACLREAIAAGTSKVNQDTMSLEREPAKVTEEMRSTRPKAEPLTPPAADVTGPPTSPPPPPANPASTAPMARQRRPAPGSYRSNHQQTHYRDPLIHPRNLSNGAESRRNGSVARTANSSDYPEVSRPPPKSLSSSSPPPNTTPPRKPTNQFSPSVKKGMCGFDVPYWIIAHLAMDCGGNVHSCGVVDVMCGSFEMETHGASPHSGRIITGMIVLRRRLLIGKLFHISIQLIA